MRAVHESNNVRELVEGILRQWLSKQHLVAMKDCDDVISRILSTCGIDYLLFCEGEVYGIASSVPYGNNYRTFTVSKTDYEKYKKAFSANSMIPYYVMHVHVDDSQIIGLGLIKTMYLIKFIANGLAEEKGRYYVCAWEDLRKAGFNVMEYRAETEEEPDEDDEGEDDEEEIDDVKDIITGTREMAEAISDILEKAHIIKRPVYCTF